MAKRSRKKESVRNRFLSKSVFQSSRLTSCVAVALAAIAFFVYWPSLKSDFVYDARIEILKEGFVTSPANLPDILSLKVLGMNLMLRDRPGQLLYLMMLASVGGKEPFGYHLGSNLLHATNVALLFIVLLRLVVAEWTDLGRNELWKVHLAAATATLLFALHPLAAETVSEVNYSSDLLVTFFTLLTLLTATFFSPTKLKWAMMVGALGAFCAFAAVTSKETGMAAGLILLVYWFLYRRNEARGPWFLFFGFTAGITIIFLTTLFRFAPSIPSHLHYLGGSFGQVFLIQPQLWVFMMGKLVWPLHLSADYTIENMGKLTTPVALAMLVIIVGLQIWLATKSRLGAMGAVIYWLGLVPVSNFIPLYCILADRFYYLPMAGVAMQLLALLLMTLRSGAQFWMAVIPCLIVLIPLGLLTLTRESVFANEFSLWSDTLQVSPRSWRAHTGLGAALAQKGAVDEAIVHYQKAVEINSEDDIPLTNYGAALFQKGQFDEAEVQLQKALAINPTSDEAHNNLGNVLFQKRQFDEAAIEFQKALALNPISDEAHNNLGNVLMEKGHADEAMAEYKKALAINPLSAEAHNDIGNILANEGRADDAMAEYQKALAINPESAEAHNDIGTLLARQGHLPEAIAEFQEALKLKPYFTTAQNNLTHAQAMINENSGGQNR